MNSDNSETMTTAEKGRRDGVSAFYRTVAREFAIQQDEEKLFFTV